MDDFNYYGLGSCIKRYNFRDKNKNVETHIIYMLNRLMMMFKYEELPDTIPQRVMELYLMVNGHSVVVNHNDNLYICFGGFSGEPNEYYVPQQYIVANPYLKLFKTYDIDYDCVLLRNDSLMFGLMPLLSRYATALVENELTMNIVNINSRIFSLIDSSDDKTKASAEKYIKDIEDGKLGIIASSALLDGIRAQPYGEHTNQRLTDLIEYEQYMRATWFNELGLNANYNMKRESIMSDESQLNDDILLPLIDDMLECRKEQVNKINDMFGTNISVSFNSSWEDNIEELEIEQEIMKGGENDDETSTDEDDLPEYD